MKNNAEEMEKQIDQVLYYVNIIRNNGGLDIFSTLFQTEFRILMYLSNHEDAHPSIMASELHVTRPNIAANLRQLEAKKFIVRDLDFDNRRQVYVNITDEGRIYLKNCDEQLKFLFMGWFSILGEETTHLLKILELSAQTGVITDEIKKYFVGQ